jgi:hypothetical protein
MSRRYGPIGYTDVMNKYGITLKPNRIKRRPVPMDFSGAESRRALLAIARRVIATHAKVIKALAKR